MAMAMATSSSIIAVAPTKALEASSAFCGTPLVQGLPALRSSRAQRSALRVEASGKKIKVKEPLGPSGDVKYRNGLDASGQAAKGKGVYQFTSKYGANVDGYSPIYNTDEWSPTGDVYAGGTNGLLLWALTLAGILLAGVLLVYNTSALAQ